MEAFEGIVIGTIEYKEKSRIVELYTPYGKENILARGASKVQASNLTFTMSLNHVSYNKTKADFPVLIDYQVKKSYYKILESLNNTEIIMVILQVIKSISADAPHHRIFPFLKRCLDMLLDGTNSLYVLSVFLIKMLAIYGVQPNFKNCVLCGNNNVVNFSLKMGGALCSNCSVENEGLKLLFEQVKFLYYDKEYIYRSDFDYVNILDFIYSYYTNHVYMKLKDYKIFKR